MLFEFQNTINIEIIWFFNASWISLGFALDFLDIGLFDKDLSNTDSDLLGTDTDSFPVHILLVSITSGRRPEDIS